MPRKALTSLAVFGVELLANPDQVGAAVPSSRALARRLAACIPRKPPGYVVELGAGTGAVTQALLDHGVPAERLIPVELSRPMVRHLRQRFPQLNVLAGDASQLSRLLFRQLELAPGSISHIVSSLPLRSLPKDLVQRIAAEIALVLPPTGRFIQYTYDLRRDTHDALADFTRTRTSIVWFNLPPARVDVFHPRV